VNQLRVSFSCFSRNIKIRRTFVNSELKMLSCSLLVVVDGDEVGPVSYRPTDDRL